MAQKRSKSKTKKKQEAIHKSSHKNDSVFTEKDLKKLFLLLQQHTHIDFSNYKLTTLSRRIQRQMRFHKIATLDKYTTFLESHPDSIKILSEDIFIHVTEFFRDPESFVSLSEIAFPRLFANNIPGIPIRVWIPGCSTGEEAYSIAILLLEFLDNQKTKRPIQIFATDISEDAIQQAREGFYSTARVKNISSKRLQRFFDKTKNGYRIKKTVRDHCIFSKHDVTSNPPFAKIDLISCRNVLIYFAMPLQQNILPVFHYSLNSNGFLWLGKSEAPSGFQKLFTLVDKLNKIYSKINTANTMSFRFAAHQTISTGKPESFKKITAKISAESDHSKELDRLMISRYAPSGVIVNNAMEIVQVRGKTSPFLELPVGQPNYNLLKMVRPELLPNIRMAFQTAVKNNASVRKEGLTYVHNREHKRLNIEIIPINTSAPLKERQFFILFEQSSTHKAPSFKKKEILKKQSAAEEMYATQLLKELDTMREYQQSLAEGYESAQEELTSTNEELQSTIEEFMSTNEELETAKEELQAANEELTTLNDELQNRNTELSSTYDQLAQSEEKFRLLTDVVRDYAIFMLDTEGHIATWNEGARRFKGYEAREIIGQHFSIFYSDADVRAKKPEFELEKARTEGKYEEEGYRYRKDGTTFWASVVITPIRDKNGVLKGFSKITRDISDRKKQEESLRNSNEELEKKVQERTKELQFALNARDEFLSIASHELKTPLTSLQLQLELLNRSLQLNKIKNPEDLREGYALALRQVSSLANLIEDLLDISRIQTGKFSVNLEEMNLSELTSEISNRFSEQAAAAQCSLHLEIEKNVIGRWDAHRIEQVITNLIQNSIKYAPGSPIHLATNSSGKTAIFTIQDFGPGIDKENHTKIFERFERGNQSENSGGLGLGLFIVKKIVEAHNGTIHVESTIGKGSKFIVRLPL